MTAPTPRWWPRWAWSWAAGAVEVDAGGGWEPLAWDRPTVIALAGPVAPVRLRGRSTAGVPTRTTTAATRDGDVLVATLPQLPLGRVRLRVVDRAR